MKAYLLGGSGVGAGIAKALCCAQCGAKSNRVGSGEELERKLAYLSTSY